MKDNRLKKIHQELASHGIHPDDLMNHSRRRFLMKSLKSTGTAIAAYRLQLISTFLGLTGYKASAMMPFSFWREKSPASSSVESGTLWTWGINSVGQLGDGTTVDKSSPVQILGNWNQTRASHAEYYYYYPTGFIAGSTFALRSDHTLWASGSNNFGRLGAAVADKKVSSPVQITGTWKQVDVGYDHTLAIQYDSTLWAWGSNGSGKLGDGTQTARSLPTQIPGSWIQVSAGENHSLGIRTNNTLWAWGNNTANGGGQLGIGPSSSVSSPVQVPGSWSQISTGFAHSIGIRTDGTLWAWGDNHTGNLGNGTNVSTNSPIQIPGSWIAASTKRFHALAIRSDNTLWAWGANFNGQLGDGTTITRSSPVQIPGTWKSVSADGHSMAIRTDGTLWTWGDNSYGQLGDGTITSKSSPVQVPGSWIQVDAGYYHSSGIKKI